MRTLEYGCLLLLAAISLAMWAAVLYGIVELTRS